MANFVTTTRGSRGGKRPQRKPKPVVAKQGGWQGVGRMLREARVTQGRSLGEVERAIKIHASHIEALESGDYGALPNPLWGRGFMITYANYLRLDGEGLAKEAFPSPLFSRSWLYLRRHWRAMVAALGAIAVAAALIVAAFVASYDPLTGTFAGRAGAILQRVAPGVFLGDEPQRVVVSGFVPDEVLMARAGRRSLAVRSIPRETRRRIPGHGRGEIGEAAATGGPDLARRSVARLVGVRVPYYCAVSTKGIGEIVDSMGGVQVEVPQEMRGRAPSGTEVTLPRGRQTLDRDQALVYLQGEDLPDEAQRATRRLDFLYAMFGQALAPSNLLSNPSTAMVVMENTETNMSVVQTFQFIGHVATLKESGAPTSVNSRGGP